MMTWYFGKCHPDIIIIAQDDPHTPKRFPERLGLSDIPHAQTKYWQAFSIGAACDGFIFGD